jgi:uncharacterized protein YjbJ (UPF0337 family)
MRWDEIQTRWVEYRPLAKRRWLALSDDQLETIGGRQDQLAVSLQASYGVTREVADREIEAWCTTFDDAAHGLYDYNFEVTSAALAPQKPPLAQETRRRTHPRR